MNLEQDWKNFYQSVAAPNWPACPSLANIGNLPTDIKREIVKDFLGHRFFIPAWELTTKDRVDLLPVHSRYKFLSPVHCGDLIRVGSLHDGGYILPSSILQTADSLLSGGISDNWDFEQQCAETCPTLAIHAYDRDVDTTTVEYNAMWANYVHRLEYLGYSGVEFADALAQLPGNRTIVKLDIEGAEYECIDGIVDNVERITCLVIEFHHVSQNQQFISSINRLLDHFAIVHMHANNAMPFPTELELPYLLEITLVRQDLISSDQERSVVYLQGLDSPNISSKCDYFLYFLDNLSKSS